ncbi:SDR family NAD(P)-dependent oxidoreductase [Pseudonocardia alni]|uniref:SDR family NAD(P)-dependent oxidoreductase n=1 Tax=Pseudonocardia alni TaxID=33907 RepID=UPI0033F5C173
MTARGTDLEGARMLVTGASSGIGRATALLLARHGARLALTARRAGELRAAADEITASGGTEPLVLPADLARPGAAAELGRAALEGLGGLDVLVNNAGASLIGAAARWSDDDRARAVFEVNLWSPLALTAAVLPALRAGSGPAVVMVTSTVQAVPLPLLGYYAASKAALAQATRSLRHELRGTGVRVVEVVPGGTDTALRDIEGLPWTGGPPRTLPAVPPERIAAALVAGLRSGRREVAVPGYVRVPLAVPVIGRAVAAMATRRIDTAEGPDGVPR